MWLPQSLLTKLVSDIPVVSSDGLRWPVFSLPKRQPRSKQVPSLSSWLQEMTIPTRLDCVMLVFASVLPAPSCSSIWWLFSRRKEWKSKNILTRKPDAIFASRWSDSYLVIKNRSRTGNFCSWWAQSRSAMMGPAIENYPQLATIKQPLEEIAYTHCWSSLAEDRRQNRDSWLLLASHPIAWKKL